MERGGKKKYKRMTTTRWEFCLFYDFLLLTSLQPSSPLHCIALPRLADNTIRFARFSFYELESCTWNFSTQKFKNAIFSARPKKWCWWCGGSENTPKNAKRMKWQLLRSKSAHKIPFLHLFLVNIPLKNPLSILLLCCQIHLILILMFASSWSFNQADERVSHIIF